MRWRTRPSTRSAAPSRDAARAEQGELPAVDGFANRAGLGVEGVVDGHAVVVGRPALLAQWSLALPPELERARRGAEDAGRTAVAVAWDGEVRGLLVVADTVKPTSRAAVEELRALGLRPVLLTGDNEATARAVAAEVGIDEVIAEVLPADKAGWCAACRTRAPPWSSGCAAATTAAYEELFRRHARGRAPIRADLLPGRAHRGRPDRRGVRPDAPGGARRRRAPSTRSGPIC